MIRLTLWLLSTSIGTRFSKCCYYMYSFRANGATRFKEEAQRHIEKHASKDRAQWKREITTGWA